MSSFGSRCIVAWLIVLFVAATALPTRADVVFAIRVAVGPQPSPPPAQADPTCTGAKRLRYVTYAAQIFSSLVVSNAVRRGSRSSTIFGSSRNAASYVGEFAIEDVLVEFISRKSPCLARADAQGILGASAILNAANTTFPRR